jgi:predicted GNAT family acetyltransferase
VDETQNQGAGMTVTSIGLDSPAGFNNFTEAAEVSIVEELSKEEETEVLDFLAERPIHTVFLSSLVRDNGLVSPHNRGSFYAYRDQYQQLKGVALLGHATVIEARTESSISVFARLARNCQNAHLIRGEREIIENFWNHYATAGPEPRRVCSELLLEQRHAGPSLEGVDLRRARLGDLDKVLAVNASMAFEEGGISPLQSDPGGFRDRLARRIEQGRIWVWFSDNRLIFKADLVGATPQVAYLEGIHVHPEERRKGYGLRCLSQLSSILLTSSQSISLTVSEQNTKARSLYEKAGYEFHSQYETIYLR